VNNEDETETDLEGEDEDEPFPSTPEMLTELQDQWRDFSEALALYRPEDDRWAPGSLVSACNALHDLERAANHLRAKLTTAVHEQDWPALTEPPV
jgi:hypothetical protein